MLLCWKNNSEVNSVVKLYLWLLFGWWKVGRCLAVSWKFSIGPHTQLLKLPQTESWCLPTSCTRISVLIVLFTISRFSLEHEHLRQLFIQLRCHLQPQNVFQEVLKYHNRSSPFLNTDVVEGELFTTIKLMLPISGGSFGGWAKKCLEFLWLGNHSSSVWY